MRWPGRCGRVPEVPVRRVDAQCVGVLLDRHESRVTVFGSRRKRIVRREPVLHRYHLRTDDVCSVNPGEPENSGQVLDIARGGVRAQLRGVLAGRGAEHPAVLPVELRGAVVADHVPHAGDIAGVGDQ
ncbi:MAG: hypothetical protein JWQ81_83 [Amycolatopsis sp.]|nr:hypothetical protein [Amycolatopsis sp.]